MAKKTPNTVSGFIAIEPDAPVKVAPLLSAENVNELRARFGQFDDYKIASLLISLAAFPDGMTIARSYPKDANTADVPSIIHARALSLVYAYVSQIPHDSLPNNTGRDDPGRTL
jgi:hypothetical protein